MLLKSCIAAIGKTFKPSTQCEPYDIFLFFNNPLLPWHRCYSLTDVRLYVITTSIILPLQISLSLQYYITAIITGIQPGLQHIDVCLFCIYEAI